MSYFALVPIVPNPAPAAEPADSSAKDDPNDRLLADADLCITIAPDDHRPTSPIAHAGALIAAGENQESWRTRKQPARMASSGQGSGQGGQRGCDEGDQGEGEGGSGNRAWASLSGLRLPRPR